MQKSKIHLFGFTMLCLVFALYAFGAAGAHALVTQGDFAIYLPLVLNSTSPSVTPTPTATNPPVLTATPTPTATVLPTRTLTPTPTSPATPPTTWLERLNYYRAQAALPPVSEDASWSDGDWKHARYCVKNDYIGHDEDPSNPWYTDEGQAAAQKGNVMVSSSVNEPDSTAIDLWMTGPFHGVGMIDPQLSKSGFGSYREAIGVYKMAATLDVIRGLGSLPPTVTFPVKWPGDGALTFLTKYSGSEWPNPLSGCAGYTAPSGLPIILQIGSGSLTPSVTAHSVLRNGAAVEHCIFDETNYTNPDASSQSLARSILNMRDAIIIIPRSPLTAGSSYTISVTANGQTYTWTFTIASNPQSSSQEGCLLK